jgi:predicted peptidase
MKAKIYILLFLSFLLSSLMCSKGNDSDTKDQQMRDLKLTLKEGASMRFSAYMPKDYSTNNSKRVLILALHYGWSGSSEYYGKSMLEDLITSAADELNCIAIAPDCPGNSWVEAKSVSAVLQLLEYAKANFNVDTSKIIITGYSLGGIGTGYFLANYPNLFYSGVIVSASLDSKSLINFGIKKFYAIHSLNDEIFPYTEVQQEALLLRMKNPLFDLVTLNGLSHYDTQKFRTTLKNCIISVLKQ